MGSTLSNAVSNILERIRKYLRDNKYEDFTDENDFADKIFEAISETWKSTWGNNRIITAIKRTTKAIYEFYRLTDTTPFGDQSPVRLKFGGADLRSLEFINALDHFYFSKFAPNTSESLRKFFIEQYLENGAALFGRESDEELEEFKQAAGEKLQNLSNRQTKTIIQTSVARIRNWGHIGSLHQARIAKARLVATLDARTTEICEELDGKIIRIGVAQQTIERLNKLEPGDFAIEMYESGIGKAISKEPVATIKKFLEDDGKTISDDLVKTGRGMPPFHPSCRTRMEGLIKGIDEDA